MHAIYFRNASIVVIRESGLTIIELELELELQLWQLQTSSTGTKLYRVPINITKIKITNQ